MRSWPDHRVIELFGIDLPIVLAPMAGPGTAELAIAVCQAGGLGSLPCAQRSPAESRVALGQIRKGTSRPVNLNFFCHKPTQVDANQTTAWLNLLAPYYRELGIEAEAAAPGTGRHPFNAEYCALVEEFRPEVVSFHFGLPDRTLFDRVRKTGAKIISSATTVAEARWLEDQGCDAIIAMGLEAGGHRGNFLSLDAARQVGTFALVPQIVDAVRVPVIAAGGVADARGIVAAFALGAAAVQIGTAYLFCPEANVAEVNRRALRDAADDDTMVTNVFTGRPARGIVNRLMRDLGPMSMLVPAFPQAAGPLAPLRQAAERAGSGDFTNLWSGQAARLCRALPAGELTQLLAQETLARLSQD
jgi:nitronate monooxygenase